MSADPSGFPDGVNAVGYAPSIFTEIDPLGLQIVPVRAGDLAVVQAAIEGFRTLGWDAAVRRAERSLANSRNETAPQNEIKSLFDASSFTNVINNAYFQDIFISNGKRAFNLNASYPVINYGVTNGIPTSDLGASYSHMGGVAKGSFSTNKDGAWTNWSISVNFSFTDRYDFGGSDPLSSAFRRLQENGLASIYNTSGSLTRAYSGRFE